MKAHLLACVVTLFSMWCISGCSSNVCESGATQECLCPGSVSGVQTCTAGGDGWGACACPPAPLSEPPASEAAQVPPTSPSPPPRTAGARNQGDPVERALAEKVAIRFLKGWQEGRYEPLGDEFDQEMRNKFSPEAQKQGHTAATAMFGDFQALEFIEMAPVGPYKAYRFKGTFTKVPVEERPEVRVVVDDQGKVGGFWCRPWTQDLAAPPPGAGAGDQGDPGERAMAEGVANRFLKGWDAGRYEPLGEEFSEDMRTKFLPNAQKSGHAATAAMFGDFQSLEFVEMVTVDTFKAYRFRGTFARAQGDARPEIRVVLDEQGKVGGFFTRPWSPTMM